MTTNQIANDMPSFNLEDFQYLYNAGGDFVGDDIPAHYDIDAASDLCKLVEEWEGAEFAVVLRHGSLGVMAEQQFSDISLRDIAIEKVKAVYAKYNGTQKISVGVLEQDGIWPQLFIPATVVMNHSVLAKTVTASFADAIAEID